MSDIRKQIKEELTKADVKSEVVRVIDSKELKSKITKLVAQELKNNPELQDQIVDITKNVLTQLYKTLWTKRNFWQSQLSNKAS